MPPVPARPPEAPTVVDVCRRQAEQRGTAPLLDDGHRRLDHTGLLEEADRAAAALAALGVGHGDRVVLSAPNSVDWVVACIGLLLAGGTVVPVNHRLGEADRHRVARVTRPRLAVAEHDWTAHGVRTVTPRRLLAQRAAPVELPAVESGDTAFVMQTSGTTGSSRFVPIEHGPLVRLYRALVPRLGVGPDDVLLGVAPLAHGFGLFGVLLDALLAGSSVRLVGHYDRATISDVVVESGVTALFAPHAVLHDLVAGGCGDRPHQLRIAVTGGEEVLLPRLRESCVALGIPRLAVGYGLTEAYGTVAFADVSDDPGVLPVLRLFPGREVRLVGPDGSPVPEGDRGAEGELVLRGDAVMSGYLPEDDDPGSGLDEDGWLHTGDLAAWAGPDLVQVRARLKETVIVNGFNVVPAEVEEVVGEDEAVGAAMVVGLPDVRSGERLVACVVPRDGHTVDRERVLAHCRERLPGYKVPGRVVVLDELPITGTGKRSRRLLREQVESMPPTDGQDRHNRTGHSDQHRKG